jgi:hypothetical protein
VSDVLKDGADVTTSYRGATLLALGKPFHLKWLSGGPMRKYSSTPCNGQQPCLKKAKSGMAPPLVNNVP